MRRREYLRAAVGSVGLTGLATTALPAAATDDASPSTRSAGPDADTRATQDEFEPLGHVDVSNELTEFYSATEVVTTPDGSHAFISRFDGFEVVDLGDPSNPEIVHTATELLADEVEEPLTAILDLKYNRERLLVSAGFPVGFVGFAVYDVSDPERPSLSSYYESARQIHNCFLYGSTAYLTAGTSIVIVDLEPDEPEQIAEWSVADYDEGYAEVSSGLRTAHDVFVQADRMYVANWDAGTWIVDVSDPANPTYVGHASDYTLEELRDGSGVNGTEPPGNDHYAQPNDDGTLLFSGVESWNDPSNDEENGEDDPGGPGGITVFDIEDPENPTELSVIEPPQPPEGEDATRNGYWTTSHNFDIVGEYLYSSWYQAGVKVHDVSDPANPEELAHWEDGRATMFWAARAAVPGEFFVASSLTTPEGSGPGGLYTFPDPTDNDATITPSGPEPGSSPATDSAPSTPSATPTRTAATTESPTPTASPTDAPTDTPSTETTSADGPGFGPLAAVGALGVGAWRFVREHDTR